MNRGNNQAPRPGSALMIHNKNESVPTTKRKPSNLVYKMENRPESALL